MLAISVAPTARMLLRSVTGKEYSLYQPHIQFVLSDVPQPSSRWLGYAAAGLGRLDAISASSCTFSELPRWVGRADVLVVEHNLPLALAQGAQGMRVFLWLDDVLWSVPGDGEHARQLRALWQGIVRHSRALAGIVTPSVSLATELRQRLSGIPVQHIPNYHDFADQPLQQRGLSLGWGGSVYHVASWRGTADVWRAALAAYTINVVGHPQVAQILRAAGIKVMERPLLSFDAYMAYMATWQAALVVVDGEYDRYRSWIKALEACWCGVPWWGAGDQVENVYYGVPGRVLDLQYAPSVDGRELREWAEEQRIDRHTAEWTQFLFA